MDYEELRADRERIERSAQFDALNDLARHVYDIAKSKGFHDEPVPVATLVTNIHGEVSELWEAYRRARMTQQCDKDTSEPLTCAEEELADILIRVLDTSVELGVDIARAVRIKSAYNETRSHRNGEDAMAKIRMQSLAAVTREREVLEAQNRELLRENEVLRSNSDHLSSENASLARQVESMAMRIESLAEELAKPEDVRLREVVEALDGRAVIFDGLGARVEHLLDEMHEWVERAGEAERLAEERLAHATERDAMREVVEAARMVAIERWHVNARQRTDALEAALAKLDASNGEVKP